MKYSLVFYILFCIALGLGGAMKLVRMDRILAAFVFFVLAILIFVFFGLRWFANAGSDMTSWPPVVNTCPDYLSAYTTGSGKNAVTSCVDMVGVSKNGSLAKFPEVRQDGSPPSDLKYYFPMNIDPAAKLSDSPQKLCSYTIQSGLSWEGLVNGISCTGQAAGGGGPSNSSGGNCPSA